MRDEKQRAEDEEAEQRTAPAGKIVYKAILKEGEGELERPSSALFWSGLAAGLSMGFSMIAEGLLMTYLPDAEWRPLVAKFGYSAGFLIVILGRQQLFTENTLNPILPLLQHKRVGTLANVARLWTIVLIANLLGAVAIAFVAGRTSAFDAHVQSAFSELGRNAMQHDFGTLMLRGIFAGWLIALVVWLVAASAEAGRLPIIIILTYVVGLGGLTHIVVGSVEVLYLVMAGVKPWISFVSGYMTPTLIGNILGGVALVSALNHAQVIAGRQAAGNKSR